MHSDHNEVNLKIRKYPHVWKLRNTLFNNLWVKEEIIMELKIKSECNANQKKSTFKNLWSI